MGAAIVGDVEELLAEALFDETGDEDTSEKAGDSKNYESTH
jgi:hypothetical protein